MKSIGQIMSLIGLAIFFIIGIPIFFRVLYLFFVKGPLILKIFSVASILIIGGFIIFLYESRDEWSLSDFWDGY